MVGQIKIPDNFEIEDVKYRTDALSAKNLDILKQLTFVEVKIREMINKKAIMTKARNAYISEIKKEIIKSKSGIDLSTLLSD
jgi:hypothetical protein